MVTKKTAVKKKVAAKKKVTTKKKVTKKRGPAKKLGRPSAFTSELGLEICERMMAGRSLRSVCSDEDMPTKTTVFRWLAKGDQEEADLEYRIFRDQYAYACELRREFTFEQLSEDLEEWAKTPVIGEDGKPILVDGKPIMTMTNQSVQFARLKLDAFKWQSSKENPKKYGEKLNLNHGGQKDNPIQSLIREVSGNALPIAHQPTEGTTDEN